MKTSTLLFILVLLPLTPGCSKTKESSQQNQNAQSQTTSSAATADSPTGDRGTPAEAQAMLQKAFEHYGSVGRKQALDDFTAKKPPFFDHDLYVVCISPDHLITANGGFPQYVNGSSDLLRDADGKPLGEAIVDVVQSTGAGSVEYRWLNPASKKIEPKTMFARKFGSDVCGVGVYSPRS